MNIKKLNFLFFIYFNSKFIFNKIIKFHEFYILSKEIIFEYIIKYL